jgi:hypothetical protein
MSAGALSPVALRAARLRSSSARSQRLDAAAPGNGWRATQLTGTGWPRPVSVAAGSQRHERAGWNGPAPLLLLLAAGSNALAPHGRGKGRDMPRRRTALIPAG